ncbi:PhnB protein [Paramicrobacterium humi]|uniref:PhnB protein n=1 Tax=Paramicrobacterium humi TaxID=640635 RepID=A0A1H4QAB6_9MICO|nr:VOC family protein [Microbacterium humi]SEC16586.1 PhnB protein [Microbacterium humi]
MPTILNAYLRFGTSAREAMSFYQSALGGDLTLNPYRDSGVPHDPAIDDLVLHGMLTTPGGLVLMGADSGREEDAPVGVSLALSGDDDIELTGYFDQLSAGGTVQEPLTRAPWGDTFGMFIDKFGVSWMVSISAGGR